jgi:D-alanyl-D-alanine carboxypeptidase/D-alanyl-D-alanine-endopeptidase (penicillin-binding protein 4)
MLRRGALAGLAVSAVVLVASAAASAREAKPDAGLTAGLKTRLARALSTPGIDPTRTGALAVDLETGQVVFQRNPSLALAPASAEKLGVAFTALRVLGPAYRFETQVLATGEVRKRILYGNLHLVGAGDPTLDVSDLDALARDLRSLGIRRVRGTVVGDEHHFDSQRGGRGWKPGFLGFECAPLSALSVEDVRVRSVDGSALAAAAAFTTALERRGITVGHHSRTGRAPTDALPLVSHGSAPLGAILRRMDRESNNFIAEMLLKEIGAAGAGRGSTAAGAAVVRTTLEQAGVPLDGVRIVDGSGLSTLDRATPRELVRLLRAAERDPAIRSVFRSSLPVAGMSGTLKDRLDRRPTRGKIVAKTGTTSLASALAGFVGERYVFAILQNGSPVAYWTARVAQDRFVTVLARS